MRLAPGAGALRLPMLEEQAMTETMWKMVKLDAKKLKRAFDRA